MTHLFSWFLYIPVIICRRPYWCCDTEVDTLTLIQRPRLWATLSDSENNSRYGVDQMWHNYSSIQLLNEFNSSFTLQGAVLIKCDYILSGYSNLVFVTNGFKWLDLVGTKNACVSVKKLTTWWILGGFSHILVGSSSLPGWFSLLLHVRQAKWIKEKCTWKKRAVTV